MSKKYILTANDLLMGDVIYLNKSNEWVRSLNQAYVFDDIEQANTALAIAEKNIALVGAYLAEVDPNETVATANHFREKFRAKGPSNYFHGKQENDNVSI